MLTCVREFPSIEHPICFKHALALKIAAKVEDRTFQPKEISTPFTKMDASSLQVFGLLTVCPSN